jgi:hypothetical protein
MSLADSSVSESDRHFLKNLQLSFEIKKLKFDCSLKVLFFHPTSVDEGLYFF